jgi:hypothetical protein
VPLDFWIFRSPTPEGIWLGFVASGIVAAVVAAVWFESGSWRDGDLTDGVTRSGGSDGDPDPEPEPGVPPADN